MVGAHFAIDVPTSMKISTFQVIFSRLLKIKEDMNPEAGVEGKELDVWGVREKSGTYIIKICCMHI